MWIEKDTYRSSKTRSAMPLGDVKYGVVGTESAKALVCTASDVVVAAPEKSEAAMGGESYDGTKTALMKPFGFDSSERDGVGNDRGEGDDFENDDIAGTHAERSGTVGAGGGWTKGSVQSPEYRDVWFGVAFVAQFLVILGCAIALGSSAFETDADSDGGSDGGSDWGDRMFRRMTRALAHEEGKGSGTGDGRNLDDEANQSWPYDDGEKGGGSEGYDGNLFGDNFDNDSKALLPSKTFFTVIILAPLISGPVLAVVALGFMAKNAESLMRASLYLSIGINVFSFVLSLFHSMFYLVIPHLIFIALLICYARSVWHRIPYAASNVKAAISAVRTNLGVALLAFAAVPVNIVWLVIWSISLMGVLSIDSLYVEIEREGGGNMWDDASGNGSDTELSGLGGFVVFLFCLCFYWTKQVIHVRFTKCVVCPS